MILTKPVYSNVTGELVGYAQGFFELSSYIDVSNKLLETLIFLEIIGVILSLVLGFLLSSYFTSPLRKMSKVLYSIEEAHKTGGENAYPKKTR